MTGRSNQRRRTAHLNRRVSSVVAMTTLAGIALSAAGVTTGVGVAAAAPNGGACAPNARFGRLVPGLPAAAFNDADMVSVGNFVTETVHLENPQGTEDPSLDESNIDAGYVYAGQFIDHDITLDPRPNTLTGFVDIATLVNNRTPQLDLDSVYGKGPAASPQLYEADGMMLRVGARQTGSASDPEARDHIRDAAGRAILGDGRNDENKITASLHTIVVRFHNKIARDIRAARPDLSNAQVFTEAQQQVRWYYQWAVLTDFLPAMSSQGEVSQKAWYDGSRWQTNLRWYDSCNGSMPFEFSTAAYRWHTMVRNDYVVNDAINDLEIFTNSTDPRANLAGGQPAPSDFGFDWDFFFAGGAREVQKAYKFDNSLVPALGKLPAGAAGTGPTNLSVRNLQRGNQLALPSGQDVARALGVPVLRDDQIIVGPALGVGSDTRALTEFSPSFAGKAPLWAYLAAESVNKAYTVSGGRIVGGNTNNLRLGPTGAAIVNETIVGLLANDNNSVINHPEFRPDAAYASNGRFTFRDLIRVGTTRMDAPTPVCTTTTAKAGLFGSLFSWLFPPKTTTTCTTPTYPNPKTTKVYTVGAPAGQNVNKFWVTGTDASTYRWNGSGWTKSGYDVGEVAAAADGTVLVNNKVNRTIWKYVNDGSYVQIPGAALDVAVVRDNVYFVIGTDSNVYRWTGSGWVQVGHNVSSISAASDGTVLVTNKTDHSIWKYNSDNNWSKLASGAAFDIAVVKNNVYFAIGTDNNVWRWTGSSWIKVGHDVSSIAAAADGTVVVTNRYNQTIWRYVADHNWTSMPGYATDIAVR